MCLFSCNSRVCLPTLQMGGTLEQIVFLDNMSNSIKVGSTQLPQIYKSLLEAKTVLGLDDVPVDIFVKSNPVPNANTMAMQVCQIERGSERIKDIQAEIRR